MTMLRVLLFSACVGAAVCQAEQLSLVAAKDTTIFENRDDLSNGMKSSLHLGVG